MKIKEILLKAKKEGRSVSVLLKVHWRFARKRFHKRFEFKRLRIKSFQGPLVVFSTGESYHYYIPFSKIKGINYKGVAYEF